MASGDRERRGGGAVPTLVFSGSDRLELGIDAELRTLDGAIEATASGYVLQGRPGFSFESPAGSVFADLREVRGTLQLPLPAGTAIARAVLSTDLFFKADRIEGDIHTYILVSDGSVSSTLYYPLGGHWPDRPESPAAPAAVARPDDGAGEPSH